jgi:hypothetical protein
MVRGAAVLTRDIASRTAEHGLFALGQLLTPPRDRVCPAMEMQTAYWRRQLGMLGAQAEELRTLSTQVTTDVTAPITAQFKRGMDELHKAT